MIQVLLLWAAVFIGLDLAFGDGALTSGLEEALDRALTWMRQLLRR
jgi:hypothetical protein